jgi:hypothetical protein
VVTVKKPKRLLRRLFQAAVGIIKENIAEGHLNRFPQRGRFHRTSPSSFCFENAGRFSNLFPRQDRL